MVSHGRLVRYRPVTSIPTIESFTQIERLVDRLWNLAERMGKNLGRKPTIISMGVDVAPPGVILSHLTQLEVEVHATYLMFGLADAWNRAIYEFTTKNGTDTVNYRKIVDETYLEEDDLEEA